MLEHASLARVAQQFSALDKLLMLILHLCTCRIRFKAQPSLFKMSDVAESDTELTKLSLQGIVFRSELQGRPMELFMCTVLKRQGYGEGFRWLAQYIN